VEKFALKLYDQKTRKCFLHFPEPRIVQVVKCDWN
jgi:hypothetical protein